MVKKNDDHNFRLMQIKIETLLGLFSHKKYMECRNRVYYLWLLNKNDHDSMENKSRRKFRKKEKIFISMLLLFSSTFANIPYKQLNHLQFFTSFNQLATDQFTYSGANIVFCLDPKEEKKCLRKRQNWTWYKNVSRILIELRSNATRHTQRPFWIGFLRWLKSARADQSKVKAIAHFVWVQ